MSRLTRSDWQPIETAPKDGSPILVWDGHAVHYAWWTDRPDYPWAMVDDLNVAITGCCDREEGDRIELNYGMKTWPKAWQPLPAPPEQGE